MKHSPLVIASLFAIPVIASLVVDRLSAQPQSTSAHPATPTAPGSIGQAIGDRGTAYIPPFRSFDSGNTNSFADPLAFANIHDSATVRVTLTLRSACGDLLTDHLMATPNWLKSLGCSQNYMEPTTGATAVFDLPPLTTEYLETSPDLLETIISGKVEYEILTPGALGPALMGSLTQRYFRYQVNPAEERTTTVLINGGMPF